MAVTAESSFENFGSVSEFEILVYLPQQKNFKREVFLTDRYKNIVKILNDPLSQIYISFLAFASTDFEEYLLSQQATTEPMIHLMYDRMVRLIYSVTKKFMKESAICKKASDGSVIPHSGKKFASLDLKGHQKRVESIDIGTRALSLFKTCDIS